MADTEKRVFGPVPWTYSICGGENALHDLECKHCDREARRTLTDGTQIYPEHRNILKDGSRAGQQEAYVVLAEEERAKGFIRPVRRSYVHLKCGAAPHSASAGRRSREQMDLR